jgi:hypothetical protein
MVASVHQVLTSFECGQHGLRDNGGLSEAACVVTAGYEQRAPAHRLDPLKDA